MYGPHPEYKMLLIPSVKPIPKVTKDAIKKELPTSGFTFFRKKLTTVCANVFRGFLKNGMKAPLAISMP